MASNKSGLPTANQQGGVRNGVISTHGFTVETKTDSDMLLNLLSCRHEATGFEVSLLPTPGRAKIYVGFLVPYGANHTKLAKDDGEVITVPEGVAHYLEHCVFSRGETGLINQLADLGVDANAYTTNSHTQFYMTLTGNLLEALKLYFYSVLRPNIDHQRVDAERGIIEAEYRMYLDDPDTCAYLDTLKQIFQSHPQRNDICGTIPSINAITHDHLKTIVDIFYQPQAIKLVLAGDIDVDAVLSHINDWLGDLNAAKPFAEQAILPQPVIACEPRYPLCKVSECHRDVAVDSFILAIKDFEVDSENRLEPQKLMMRRLDSQLLAEMLLGDNSTHLQELLDSGLLNDGFGLSYIAENNCAYWLLSGDSRNPHEAVRRLQMILQNYPTYLEMEVLPVEQRSFEGRFIANLDDVNFLGAVELKAKLFGTDIINYCQIWDRVSLQNAATKCLLDPEAYTVSYTYRKENNYAI